MGALGVGAVFFGQVFLDVDGARRCALVCLCFLLVLAVGLWFVCDSLVLHRWSCLTHQWCIDGDVAFINRINCFKMEFWSG